jgi:hypothetical protein
MCKKWIVLFLCFYAISGFAQNSPDLEDTLSKLSEKFIAEPDSNARLEAFEKFELLLTKFLNEPNSFGRTFDSLHSLSILYPSDSSFRIFTTQVQTGRDRFRHFGALQWKDSNKSLVIFKDQSDQIEETSSIILKPENWYGALYYNMISFGSEDNQKYLLFGYDSYSLFHRRKLIDVINLGKDSISFGAPVLQRGNSFQSRFLLQYSADVKVLLNYDPDLGIIMYDNLIPIKGPYPGQGIIMVPDGSYRGFKLENGIWAEVGKIFFQIQDVPPGDSIPDKGTDRDLFGRERKG